MTGRSIFSCFGACWTFNIAGFLFTQATGHGKHESPDKHLGFRCFDQYFGDLYRSRCSSKDPCKDTLVDTRPAPRPFSKVVSHVQLISAPAPHPSHHDDTNSLHSSSEQHEDKHSHRLSLLSDKCHNHTILSKRCFGKPMLTSC